MDPSNALSEDELAQLQPTPRVKITAALGGIAGAFSALAGLHFVTSAEFREPLLNAVPWALAITGAVQLVLALRVARNHYGASIALVAVSLLDALLAFAWMWLSLANAMISMLVIVAVPLAGCAAFIAPLATQHTRRAHAIRQKLKDSGMELGF